MPLPWLRSARVALFPLLHCLGANILELFINHKKLIRLIFVL